MELSSEQKEIINKLEFNNISINAIAGSGKTSTIINSVINYPKKTFLIITYNKALQLETKEKLSLYHNSEVHTYHSVCTKYYDSNAHTDFYLLQSANKSNLSNREFDVLILDEAQDIKLIYYPLIIKLINDFKIKRLCLFGDYKQNIYSSLGSTIKYLIDPTLFNFQKENWINLKLSYSFRCSDKVCKLINQLMNEQYLTSSKPEGDIELIYYKTYKLPNPLKFIENKIIELKNIGYKYSQMMILFPSFKYSFVNPFINSLQDTIGDINIIALTNVNIDARSNSLLLNKIIISSVHSSKGLERDVVILLPFNELFNDMSHNYLKLECSNLLYVALTRAKEKLILYKHIENISKQPYTIPLLIDNKLNNDVYTSIQFSDEEVKEKHNLRSQLIINDIINSKHMSFEELKKYLTKKYKSYIIQLEKYLLLKKLNLQKDKKVKDYLSFKPIEYYMFFENKFKTKLLYKGQDFIIKKEIYNTQRNIYEDVSTILGMIIPMYIEMLLTKKIILLTHLKDYHSLFSEKDLSIQITKLQRLAINYSIEKDQMYKYKNYQVPYKIIEKDLFISIVKFGYNYINELNANNDYELFFEYYVHHNNLKGSIDLLMKSKNEDNLDIIIEFKLTTINDIGNYIQIILYAILYCEINKKDINKIKLLYINLSNSSVYMIDFKEYYNVIKDYIEKDILIKIEESKQPPTLKDYFEYLQNN
jgi:hypothetical protein